jgi:hypothetical protein
VFQKWSFVQSAAPTSGLAGRAARGSRSPRRQWEVADGVEQAIKTIDTVIADLNLQPVIDRVAAQAKAKNES